MMMSLLCEEGRKDDEEEMFLKEKKLLTGVATTTSGFVLRSLACACSDNPPTASAALMSVKRAREQTIEWTCAASSRVGSNIKT